MNRTIVITTLLALTAANCAAEGFARKMFVEKRTSQTCGNCPIGIYSFDYMNEHYPDQFIGVEVHEYGDDLICSDYSGWQDFYKTGGTPSVLISRCTDYSNLAQLYNLTNYIQYEARTDWYVGLTASFTPTADPMKINATATIQVAEEQLTDDWRITFIITEDQVGPYTQLNYPSATSDLPGWEDKGQYVSMLYNDVARSMHSDWKGIEGSVPAKLTASEPHIFTVNDFSLGKTTNPDNASLIALLLNKDGEVINADRVGLKSGGTSEIREVTADGAPTLFDLTGRPASSSSKGIVVQRHPDGTTTKRLLK